jgi:hypothetical protein
MVERAGTMRAGRVWATRPRVIRPLPLQHLQVQGDSLHAHVERFRQFGQGRLVGAQALQD